MKCGKCEGKGYVDNNRYWNAKSKYQTCYYLRFEPTVKCSICEGSGYVIGNIKDVLSLLKHLEVKFEMENNKYYLEQVKQCISTIEN